MTARKSICCGRKLTYIIQSNYKKNTMLSHLYNVVTTEPTMMWYVSLVGKLSEFVYSELTGGASDIIEGYLIIL